MNTKLTVKSILALSTSALCAHAVADVPSDTNVDFYGSIRAGVSIVDTGNTENVDDGANGRDYLSRVGVKASTEIKPGLTGIAMVEYGLRDETKVDFAQNGEPTMRQMWVGLKGDFGTIKFGSQTNIWHTYARATYFSSAVDSLRQGAIRDDDLLQYFYKSGDLSFAAGIQMEDQDGDDIDQFQTGIAYTWDALKLQAAYSKDNRGDNKGNLYGLAFWWTINDNVTLAGFTHQADEDYDLYAGGSAGYVIALNDDEKISPIQSCATEDRATNGGYLRYKSGKHQIGGRYAVESCDVSGDASSIKVEYLYRLSDKLRGWVSYEMIEADDTRKSDGVATDDFSEIQLAVRYDF